MNIFNINKKLLSLSEEIELNLKNQFQEIEKTSKINENKVLKAFLDCKISTTDFVESTGYGYGDSGREKLDKLFSSIFKTEDSLVRCGFVSGTHTIATALFSVLEKGDKMLCVTSTPYPTIRKTIGIEKNKGSLKDLGIIYNEIDIFKNDKLDKNLLLKNLKNKNVKMVYIQRSKGYCVRKSVSIKEIEEISNLVHNINKDTIIFIDNCYGEFVEEKEPTQVGADLICGSLIKNPGGAIAKSGGYITGRKNLIELCAQKFTAPGLGKEMGCNFNQNRDMFLGIFLAPMFVCNALKNSLFSRAVFKKLGFCIHPDIFEKTSDIVSVIELKSKEKLQSFCEGIQKNSPIDSFVTPILSSMPGYENEVIMACGSFVNGASLELSADCEVKPPYNVFLQGGISYNNAKIAILNTIQKMINEKQIEF